MSVYKKINSYYDRLKLKVSVKYKRYKLQICVCILISLFVASGVQVGYIVHERNYANEQVGVFRNILESRRHG